MNDDYYDFLAYDPFSTEDIAAFANMGYGYGDEFNPYVGTPLTVGGTGSSYETGAGLPGEEAVAGSQGGTGGTGNVIRPTGGLNAIRGLTNALGLTRDNGTVNPFMLAGLAALLGTMGRGSSAAPTGYQGGIPAYTARREQIAMPADTTRRPGSSGRQYFTPIEYVPKAQGGIIDMARGKYLDGPTDGMADKLPATIEEKQPARLSHGEFVVPADVVSHLGNGNSNAGAERLYSMMDRIRKARTGNPKQGKQINPDKYLPA